MDLFLYQVYVGREINYALPELSRAPIASPKVGKIKKSGSTLVISNSFKTRSFTPDRTTLWPDLCLDM